MVPLENQTETGGAGGLFSNIRTSVSRVAGTAVFWGHFFFLIGLKEVGTPPPHPFHLALFQHLGNRKTKRIEDWR